MFPNRNFFASQFANVLHSREKNWFDLRLLGVEDDLGIELSGEDALSLLPPSLPALLTSGAAAVTPTLTPTKALLAASHLNHLDERVLLFIGVGSFLFEGDGNDDGVTEGKSVVGETEAVTTNSRGTVDGKRWLDSRRRARPGPTRSASRV